MADDPLAPFLAKLDRADQSLRSFNRKLRAVERAETIRVRVKLDRKTGWHTAYVTQAEPLSPAFGVLVGECLYHGRSVLEQLVWALVKANHKKPGAQHTFPILSAPPTPRHRESGASAFIRVTKARQLAGVPMGAIALIEGLQPYNRGDQSTYSLSILNDMAIEDRHHAVHAVFVGGRDANVEHMFVPPRGSTIIEFKKLFRTGQSLGPDTKLARFRLNRWRRRPQVRVEGGLPVFVAFGDRKTRLVATDVLQEVNQRLRSIIESFAEFL